MDAENEGAARREARHMDQTVRIVLRPYASALPLGCFAFAIGNGLYSAFLLGWIPANEAPTLALMLLAFAAPLELLPCVMAFLSRDTGAATAMGVFGFSWVVQGAAILQLHGDPPNAAAGIFLLAIAVCLAVITAVTIGGKPMLGVMTVVAAARSVCAALLQFGLHGALPAVPAVLGLTVTAIAFYAGLGLLLEDVRGVLLPMTFRKQEARAALEGDLEHQVRHLQREAGVREQL